MATATRRFESTGREFMAQTLLLAKQLRPRAAWGYYAFPYCFNMNGGSTSNGQREDCSAEVQRENDRIQWLFDDSDIIFPSVYLREKLGAGDRIKLIRGRVKEAVRMARRANVQPKPRVLTYIRYVYTDSVKYLSENFDFDEENSSGTEPEQTNSSWPVVMQRSIFFQPGRTESKESRLIKSYHN
ncbi:AAEL012759-PA [Aedes aegypti]|uniref:Hyaluronidase n=1 Tax=Aedes aegypti TaxID=7159 RepID=Q16L58_AEDAE|nr:AAEL012759-PA [Aedes aegypti]